MPRPDRMITIAPMIFATGPDIESRTFWSHDSHGMPDPDACASIGSNKASRTVVRAIRRREFGIEIPRVGCSNAGVAWRGIYWIMYLM
jgi:hypothetical protein